MVQEKKEQINPVRNNRSKSSPRARNVGEISNGVKKPEISALEQNIEFKRDAGPAPEKREVLSEEEIISDKLRREIEMMELDEKLKGEAEKKAQKISFLGEDKKIEHLLKIAREKGVIFAVQVAKKMNDPYLLDIFHDILAREGYYQKFMK